MDSRTNAAALAVDRYRWEDLINELFQRGADVRESGAFLLGTVAGAHRQVEDVIYYDDLDPHALEAGYVVLHADAFCQLWDRCNARNLQVVADIHTHPELARQSRIDQVNPMIQVRGHLALILPRYAKQPFGMDEVGMYHYRGSYAWDDIGFSRIHHHLLVRNRQ